MRQIILESLTRQSRGLALLRDLLEEEYRSLLSRKTDEIASLEFSIQELIRQLAVEKSLVNKSLGGCKVVDYASMLPEEQALPLKALFQNIDESEQYVSRLASRNAQLSLALLDQSTRTLNALTGYALPPKANTYGRKGGMNFIPRPEAALISGRL
ncbi:MAG: flagellar protein FlgN [Desulfovibrio sp.]|jgi:flagellar biosynthesis/type III secretory pathway chaperone|nr:flagellar protein FlgN [Desulfovibrio sp.]